METTYIEHHGIKGQKWGDRNGPPYPLKPSDHSSAEKKAARATSGGVYKRKVKYGGLQDMSDEELTKASTRSKLESTYRQREASANARNIKNTTDASNLSTEELKAYNDRRAAVDQYKKYQKDDYYQATMQQERSNERMRYASALYRRTMWGVVAFAAVLLIAGFLVARDRLRVVATRRKAEVWQRKHEVDNHIHEAIRRRQDEQMLRQNMEAQHTLLRQREGTISFLQDFVLQRSEAIRKLKGIAERPILFSPHEWQEVERTLDAIDEDRFARIRQRYPELRDEDIQVCILTRLRLPNRAIGNLFSITVSAAQHRKLKIKKEIFGEPNPDITLEQVLARL
jgi:hypothetical protein